MLTSNPERYLEEIKNRAIFNYFTVESIGCEKNVKTSDVTLVKFKEVSSLAKGYWKCEESVERIKVGSLVGAHVDPISSEILSLSNGDKELISYARTLDSKASNYQNYYIVYMVMALVFLIALVKELRKTN